VACECRKQKANALNTNKFDETVRKESFVSKSARTFASKTINNSSQNNEVSMVQDSSNPKTPRGNSVMEMTKRAAQ
jgi:hypothetical protein